jgi:hypothetical protein
MSIDEHLASIDEELVASADLLEILAQGMVGLADRFIPVEERVLGPVTASVRYRIEQTDDNLFIVVDTKDEARDVDIFDTEDEAQDFVRIAAIGDMPTPATDIPTKIAGLESRVAELESLVASMMTHEMTVTDITPEGAY